RSRIGRRLLRGIATSDHHLIRGFVSSHRTVVREHPLENRLSQDLPVNRRRDPNTVLSVRQKTSFNEHCRKVAVAQDYKTSSLDPSITNSQFGNQCRVH